MTVAGVRLRRKPWWSYVPIPTSWILSDGDRGGDRDRRDRDRDLDLDDTRPLRRRWDEQGPPPPPPAPRVQVPLAVIVTLAIYLVGQLMAGIWWAATLQSNQQHEMADRAKEESRLWQTVETYRLQVEALRREMARAGIKSDVP